jgi:SAM-dependent methyltransferase
VLGVDYSETAVELARQNALREGLACRFERGDVTRLEGCESEAFGLVVDNHCMHCVVLAEHRRSAWSELVRVLRPGGIFFGETMSREGSYDPAIVPVDPETHVARNHTRIWVSEQEVRAELAAARARAARPSQGGSRSRHWGPALGGRAPPSLSKPHAPARARAQ